MKLLLFDIDGTLVSTGRAGGRALNRAICQVVGIVNALDGVRLHGKTDPAIIREVFTARAQIPRPGVLQEILEMYVRLLPEEVQQSTDYTVLPGILRFLEDFGGHPQVACGLATGNIERGARIKLERGNLNRFFEFGGFGSDHESRTELVRKAAEKGARHTGVSIDPRETFVIGDTPRDILAGREAGFRTVGVATSAYTAADLEAAGADLVVSDFERGRASFLSLAGID
ncbi:MAG TPA: HAD hydrolase-like protein [Terriglobia bacterium]|nr:HAD hydrolase-like protein [Terriglobia bacterium]